MSVRTALVTGGNRGIGKETCRQLIDAGLRVILSARHLDAAKKAAAELGAQAIELDVSKQESIDAAVAELKERFGSIDVLVNNAGVALDGLNGKLAAKTLQVNVRGVIALCDAIRPLLSDSANIVMVSSGMGELSCLAQHLRERILEPDFDRGRLDAVLDEFVFEVDEGSYLQYGWPGSAYRVSKVGLNAFTRILATELAGTGIKVNAVCPGWVRTDMGGASASRSVEEGARSSVWAALLPEDGPTGGFFRDGEAIDW